MAVLKLMRPYENANQLGEMTVYLNGKPIANILNNETKQVVVQPGKYKLKAKMHSQGSKNYKFIINENETKAFVISTDNEANKYEGALNAGSASVIIAFLVMIYYFMFAHNRYLVITELNELWKK